MPKITKKGQVTIPKKIREAIGVKPGSEVNFQIHNGECILKKVVKGNPIRKWTGYLKIKKTTDQIIKELRGE